MSLLRSPSDASLRHANEAEAIGPHEGPSLGADEKSASGGLSVTAFTKRKKAGRSATSALAVAAPEIGIPVAIGERIAQAGTEIATKALTTDIYVRRHIRQVGTKTKPILEESELHVNGLGVILLGAASVGVALGGALLAYTARDRTVGKGFFNPITLSIPGWFDNFNRTASEVGWVRNPGQLFYHRPKQGR